MARLAAARAEYDRRLGAAFVELEGLVGAGQLGSYGLSSNVAGCEWAVGVGLGRTVA
jgi:hypothetical protein